MSRGRKYCKVSPRLHTGRLGRALRGEDVPKLRAQSLAAYLCSCPHGNAIGLFFLPVGYIMADRGWGIDGAYDALAMLQRSGFVHYDKATEWAWVTDYFRHEFGTDPDPKPKKDGTMPREDTRRPLVRKLLAEAAESGFLQGFLDHYRSDYPYLLGGIDAPSMGHSMDHGPQEQEQEQEQESPPHKPPRGGSISDPRGDFLAAAEAQLAALVPPADPLPVGDEENPAYEKRCSTCKAVPWEPCMTRGGDVATKPHAARVRAAGGEPGKTVDQMPVGPANVADFAAWCEEGNLERWGLLPLPDALRAIGITDANFRARIKRQLEEQSRRKSVSAWRAELCIWAEAVEGFGADVVTAGFEQATSNGWQGVQTRYLESIAARAPAAAGGNRYAPRLDSRPAPQDEECHLETGVHESDWGRWMKELWKAFEHPDLDDGFRLVEEADRVAKSVGEDGRIVLGFRNEHCRTLAKEALDRGGPVDLNLEET